jgi:hypothetical protein
VSNTLSAHVGDQQMAAGAQDPGELGKGRPELVEVAQRQCADHDVDVVAGQRQIRQDLGYDRFVVVEETVALVVVGC